MNMLHDTSPNYIRCLKPNEEKRAALFDGMMILKQLRYSGMLESIKIRMAGYAVRFEYEEFISHYGSVVPTLVGCPQEKCQQVCVYYLQLSVPFKSSALY